MRSLYAIAISLLWACTAPPPGQTLEDTSHAERTQLRAPGGRVTSPPAQRGRAALAQGRRPTSPRQHADADDISSLLETFRADNDLPGIVGGVVAGDRLIAVGSAEDPAIANLADAWPPLTIDKPLTIGSNTKAMTFLVLGMVLEESPDFSWDSTLLEVFGNISALTPMGESIDWHLPFQDRTLRELAAMRIGLREDAPAPWAYPTASPAYGWAWNATYDWDDYLQPSETARKVRMKQLRKNYTWNALTNSDGGTIFPVGEHKYSNISAVIAGYAAELISGDYYENLVQQKLFDAYDMDCVIGYAPVFDSTFVGGYTRDANNTWEKTEPSPKDILTRGAAVLAPAGVISCNAYDLANYAIAHHRTTSDVWLRTHRPLDTDDNYAYGWHVAGRARTKSSLSMAHNGQQPTKGTARFFFVPDRDMSYFVTSNTTVSNTVIGNAITLLRDAYPIADGCPRGRDQRVQIWDYDEEIYGCAGAETYADRHLGCDVGSSVCTSADYMDLAQPEHGTDAPMFHAWVDDHLNGRGLYDGRCSATWSNGTVTDLVQDDCDDHYPMRVCAPTNDDVYGNTCTWVGCGYDSYGPNAHFGGCNPGPSAGSISTGVTPVTAGSMCCGASP